jgi:hypothetical protein
MFAAILALGVCAQAGGAPRTTIVYTADGTPHVYIVDSQGNITKPSGFFLSQPSPSYLDSASMPRAQKPNGQRKKTVLLSRKRFRAPIL